MLARERVVVKQRSQRGRIKKSHRTRDLEVVGCNDLIWKKARIATARDTTAWGSDDFPRIAFTATANVSILGARLSRASRSYP